MLHSLEGYSIQTSEPNRKTNTRANVWKTWENENEIISLCSAETELGAATTSVYPAKQSISWKYFNWFVASWTTVYSLHYYIEGIKINIHIAGRIFVPRFLSRQTPLPLGSTCRFSGSVRTGKCNFPRRHNGDMANSSKSLNASLNPVSLPPPLRQPSSSLSFAVACEIALYYIYIYTLFSTFPHHLPG